MSREFEPCCVWKFLIALRSAIKYVNNYEQSSVHKHQSNVILLYGIIVLIGHKFLFEIV